LISYIRRFLIWLDTLPKRPAKAGLFVPMTALTELLKDSHILPHLPDCLEPSQRCYLVGGALRDQILDRPVADFDFAMAEDPTPLARRFAARIGASWFMLDTMRHQSRAVLKAPHHLITYDFAPFRAETLDEDLKLRDFTVNALAVELRSDQDAHLLDPHNGMLDLRDRILRQGYSKAFEDDPVRILRGVRLSTTLAFTIEPHTQASMTSHVSLLGRSPFERIRSEVAHIFNADEDTRALDTLERLGVLSFLFDEKTDTGSFAAGIHLSHVMSRRLTGAGLHCLRPYWPHALIDDMTVEGISRFAVFLKGFFPIAQVGLLLRKMRFSNRFSSIVLSLLRLNEDSIAGLASLRYPGRPRALWVSQLGPDPVLSLIFMTGLSENPQATACIACEAIRDFRNHATGTRVPDLVDGNWIRRELNIHAGKVIGDYLARLRCEEMAGRVSNRDEACNFLKSLDQKNIDKHPDPS